MFVFTGLLRLVGDDDALATVLSHEMAHALAHHASERVAREQQGGGNVLRALSYERMQEDEADHIGVFLMTFAEYDPRRAVLFWQRMQQAHGGQSRRPEILSDHPSDEHRIQNMKRYVPAALAGWRQYQKQQRDLAAGR
jgi:predicted Zn-dependent protease